MSKQMKSAKREKLAANRMLDRLFDDARSAESAAGAVPDDSWRADVMRAVRRVGPLPDGFRPAVPFGQLAWRLAPVALVLIVVLSVMALRAGSTMDHQLVSMAVADPVDAYVMYIPF